MSYTLTFSNLIGEFVTDKELLGAQDPYVVFEAGGRKSQTKAIKSAGAGTCEWKETYTLHEFSPKSSSTLDVTVYNHNTLRPDGTLGSGTVNLNNLGESQLSGSGDRITVPLTDKKGKNVGALKFIIHGGGFSGTGSTRSSGTGSGYGTGTGAGVGAAGAGAAGLGHTGTGHHHGSGTGSGTGQVTGVGAGSNYGTAKAAADKAAHENRDVTIQNSSGTAAGRPTNTGTGYDETSRSTGTGATSGTTGTGAGIKASGVRGLEGQAGEVIDRKYYTGFEDRPQEQALVEQFREHNPYAKQYETTVQHTGRERLVGSSIEALGTNERVVGSDHHVHAHPHDHIARALPKGAIAERPGGEGWVQGKAGPVCDSSTFEVTGDRTVDKERVTNLREHREFEKEFEVKTAYTGERQLQRGGETEQLNRERVLLDEKNKVACDGHPTVDAQTGGHSGTGPSITGGHHHGHGHHHSGTGITGGTTGTGTGIGSRGTETGTGSTGYGAGSGTTGTGYGSGTGATGTGAGYGSGTGATGTGGTGSGYGSGTGTGTGTSGYGTGAGTGTGSGSGYGSGTGATGQSGTAGMTTTQKIASLVPGTEANKEKKAAQGNY